MGIYSVDRHNLVAFFVVPNYVRRLNLEIFLVECNPLRGAAGFFCSQDNGTFKIFHIRVQHEINAVVNRFQGVK